MKTVFKFIKKVAKAYFKMTSENYMWLCTGNFPPVYDIYMYQRNKQAQEAGK